MALPVTLRSSFAAAALFVVPMAIHAQGWIEPSLPPDAGTRPASDRVTRVATNIRASVEGRVARIEVEEQFRNTGSTIAEGTYHYPMSGEAVFQSLSLWMGQTEMRGELLDAARARSIYEAIVRRRRDPALVTLAGHQLLRAQVFPIQPGETRKVVLRFTQLLDREGDALRWRYALGPEERSGATPDIRVTLVEPARFGRPFSPTHAVQVQGAGDRTISITGVTGGDVELFLPLRSTAAGLSVATHAPGGEHGYFLLHVTPPDAGEAQRIGRDLTMVVDVSGSMSGAKIQQAKAAVQQVLGTLTLRDRFRLVSFSSGVHTFRDRYSVADAEAIAAARRWTDALVAEGGTNIEGALREALQPERVGTEGNVRRDNLRVLVFLTDGVPSIGEVQPERLAAMATQAGGTRVFTIGIGSDVNTYLLERLAEDGRGTAAFVPPAGDVEVTVGNLARKLRAPALVDLRIVSSPVRIVSMEPVRMPDLFAGQELVVLGRYEGGGSGPLVIEGQRDGQRVRVSTPVVFAQRTALHEYVSTLWAARRIGALTRTMRLEGVTQPRMDEITALALRHGIVTEYTAYLVQEPVLTAESRLLPAGDQRRRAMLAPTVMAAPAAAQQTGRASFEAAQLSADYVATTSVAEAQKVNRRMQDRVTSTRGASTTDRVIGGRRYVTRDSRWIDAAQRTQRIVSVQAFSAAYLALLRALPELRDAMTMGDDVLVAGTSVSVRVQPTGRTTMNAEELVKFVKAFRGA